MLFQKSLEFVLRWEGGLSDNSADPGCLTKYGISLKAYPKIGRDGIRNLTRKQAEEIYHRDYWLASGADKLIWPLCLVVLDTSVNLGVPKTLKITLQAFKNGNPSVSELCRFVIDARLDHYNRIAKANPKLKRFLKGWKNRVNALKVLMAEIG